jgi:3-hydroxybutyryl-CoA dehydratase
VSGGRQPAPGAAREAATRDGAPGESAPRDGAPRDGALPASLWSQPFDELSAGERFVTPARTIGAADIAAFAALTGDEHPQHTDAEWAADSRFGERIAHGLLVLSCAIGLLPLDPDRVVALRRIGDAVFKQPVKIGDTVRVEGEVLATRPVDDEHGLVECRWRVLNQHGKLVLRASAELLWRRSAVAEPILI